MTVYLLLTACAAGAGPVAIPPPGYQAYPAAGYATVSDVTPVPVQQPYWQVQQPYWPVQQPYWPIVPVAGCAGGNCGHGGCAAPSVSCCDDGCGRQRRCFRHKRNDCCELPCGHPDYQAMASDCGCGSKCRCGLLSRLRNCFKRNKCCDDCNSCCKPSLRDRLKKCFHKNDCCEQTCCKPSLHERLRACFRRCKKDDCCSTSAASPAGQPEPIKPPKEMPKEKEAAGLHGPLPKGPPVNVISEVPF